MTDHRYAPPASLVADQLPVAIARPASVTGAAWLLGAAYLVSAAGSFYQFRVALGGNPGGMLIYFAVGSAIGISISIWIIRAIWIGKNWARVSVIVVLCLKVAMGFKYVPLMAKISAIYNATYLLSFAMLAIAVVLLFTRDARTWFAPRVQATG